MPKKTPHHNRATIVIEDLPGNRVSTKIRFRMPVDNDGPQPQSVALAMEIVALIAKHSLGDRG